MLSSGLVCAPGLQFLMLGKSGLECWGGGQSQLIRDWAPEGWALSLLLDPDRREIPIVWVWLIDKQSQKVQNIIFHKVWGVMKFGKMIQSENSDRFN